MRNRLPISLQAALAAASLLYSAPALAQEREIQKSYMAAKLMLGIGGELETETPAASVEDDLELSWGAGLQYMGRLHPHFALGVLLGFQSWQSDTRGDLDLDRNVLVDFAVVPAGMFAVSRDVELYLALGLGLSIDFIGDDELNVGGTLVTAEIDAAIGFALLPVIGARFALSRDVGLLAELGYALHSYEHEAEGTVAGFTGSTDFDLSLGQLALNLGVFF
jgi:hypothetical protein